MRMQAISLIFAVLAVMLFPFILSGCGAGDEKSDYEAENLHRNGFFVIGAGFEHSIPASLTYSVNGS